MVVKRSAGIAATSRADDLALRALAEIAAITSDENVRIVGGQMVALLMAAFPVPGISPGARATPTRGGHLVTAPANDALTQIVFTRGDSRRRNRPAPYAMFALRLPDT